MSKIVDAAERVGWTFVQAFAGTIVASNALSISGFDWKADLISAGSAALIALAKVLGVNSAVQAQIQTDPKQNSTELSK